MTKKPKEPFCDSCGEDFIEANWECPECENHLCHECAMNADFECDQHDVPQLERIKKKGVR